LLAWSLRQRLDQLLRERRDFAFEDTVMSSARSPRSDHTIMGFKRLEALSSYGIELFRFNKSCGKRPIWQQAHCQLQQEVNELPVYLALG
jgi:hypothetical protein